MSDTSAVQATKLIILGATGLSKDALHIYFGLAVFLGASLVARRNRRSWLPVVIAALVALAGELIDMVDGRTEGSWRWHASVHDLINTLFWPFILYCLVRFTSVFAERQ